MIVYKAFSYSKVKDTFLSEQQARYALKFLWYLASGSADWSNDVVIRFKAITVSKVNEMLDVEAGGINYVPIVDLIPAGFAPDLDSDSMPALCLFNEDEGCRIQYNGTGYYPVDLVALTFILLTRWEEWSRPVFDRFKRYDETASLAMKHGFHQRPLLDEWGYILRPWLLNKAPGWTPSLSHPSISISHDIDHLFYYKNWSRLFRGACRDLIHKHSLVSALQTACSGLVSHLDQSKDPCFTAIDDLIQFDESLGLKSTFFLMSAETSDYDDGYDIQSSLLTNKIEMLTRRGHDIAWHPSFYAAHDIQLFAHEFQQIKKLSTNHNFGIRYHYLRWQAGYSWPRIEKLGLKYDASLGYSRTCGFRCSTSHSFPAYDLIEDRELQLEVRPFTLMDGYLLQNLSSAEQIVKELLSKCHKVNGCFSLVIHNYTVMTHPGFLNLIRQLLV